MFGKLNCVDAVFVLIIVVGFVSMIVLTNDVSKILSAGPTQDFGGPIPIGTVVHKRALLPWSKDADIVTDRRVWVMPWGISSDTSDPVILHAHGAGVVETGTLKEHTEYYMTRAEYTKARGAVQCDNIKTCKAYMADGNAGLVAYEEWRTSVNNDVNDDRYIFRDGTEISGSKILERKRLGQKIGYPDAIVSRGGGWTRPSD